MRRKTKRDEKTMLERTAKLRKARRSQFVLNSSRIVVALAVVDTTGANATKKATHAAATAAEQHTELSQSQSHIQSELKSELSLPVVCWPALVSFRVRFDGCVESSVLRNNV